MSLETRNNRHWVKNLICLVIQSTPILFQTTEDLISTNKAVCVPQISKVYYTLLQYLHSR